MAKGGALRRFQTVMGLVGIVSLVIMYSLVTGWNPLPSWADWIRNHTDVTLSEPATGWVKRAGDPPDAATWFGNYVVAAGGGSVEVRVVSTGEQMWSHTVEWAAAAGDRTPVVVAASEDHPGGFDVYDVPTGLKLWSDNSKDAVWPYADKLLILHCGSDTSCALRAVDPVSGKAMWTTTLSGAGRSVRGLRPAFAGLVPLTGDFGAALDAVPHPAPALIGLRLGGDLHVVATRDGHNVRTYHPDRDHRISVVDREVVIATAAVRGDVCYPTIEGHDPTDDQVLWRRPGIGAGTTGGYDCDERKDPAGTGSAILVTDTDGKQALLDVRTGAYMFRLPTGDKVAATDGTVAVVRPAKGGNLYAVNLADGSRMWSHAADPHAMIAVAPDLVVIADPGNEKLIAVDRTSGAERLVARSGSVVLGFGDHLLVIKNGRSYGLLGVPGGAP